MVRSSETNPGDYTLSVLNREGVRHYKITCDLLGIFHLSGCDDRTFKSLADIVHYYVAASHGIAQPFDWQMIDKLEENFSRQPPPASSSPQVMLPGQYFQNFDGDTALGEVRIN